MRVSLEWLRDFVNVYMSVEELSHALTMAGFEVEAVEESGGDRVFEINVTPNRPDCLSVLGIAREVSAVTGVNLKLPPHTVSAAGPCDVSIEIEDRDLCRRYAGRSIKGVKIAESPAWMKARLERCGIRPINNVVDITNYMLFEFGHPLHAFDLDTLKGKKIKVATAGADRIFATLDGVERRLPEDALLIWDGERPVAVAGVMGGADTEVTETTSSIFLESAWFRPDSVRRTSKRLGLKTESSYRFERGTDIEMLEAALDRAAMLISEIAGGEVSEIADSYPLKYAPSPIAVRFDRVGRLLGTELSREDIINTLKRLNLDLKEDVEAFEVMPPPYRLDLKLDADVIEEVARLYGYDRIPASLPSAEITLITFPGGDGRRALSVVKDAMRKEGFSEAINFSFMDERYPDILSIPSGDQRRKAVRIKNPLRPEDSLLRTMLVPSLMGNFIYNFSRGVKSIRIFETSKVFIDRGGPQPFETLRLGAVFYSEKTPTLYKETAGDFYILKGAVESLLDAIGVSASFEPSTEAFLHPGKSADLYVGGEKAGFLGVLSPPVVEKLDVKPRAEVLLSELDADRLIASMPKTLSYRPIPKFPAVERDIAIVLDEGIKAAEVMGLIRSYPSEFIEDVAVFDLYKGGSIPAGKKSLAFAIRYRAKDRTLTDEEIESLHGEIVSKLVKGTGGEVRK